MLDVQLSGMSGIQLAQRLIAEGGHAPFIFVTAHDDSATRARAKAAGCADYFCKNESGAEVVKAIRRVAG